MAVELAEDAEMDGKIGGLEVGWLHLPADYWRKLVAEALAGS